MDGLVWLLGGNMKRMSEKNKSWALSSHRNKYFKFLLLFKNDDEWRRDEGEREKERNDEERKGNHIHTHTEVNGKRSLLNWMGERAKLTSY